jgi:teichuronic acid biosynthesis protein TuaE
MNIARTLNNIQDAFFRWGWLIPAALPLAQVGGRGLFNSIAIPYALWGLVALWRRRSRLDRLAVLPYLALVGVFLIGIPGAVDPGASLKTWSVFLMLSFSFLLMLAAMGESPGHPDRFLGATALFGAFVLAALVLIVPYFAFGWSGVPFDPSHQLKEDGLPFLLPFVLGWIWRRGDKRWRYGAMAGIALVALAYVVLAQGRAALLGMVVGLAVFCWAVLGWRLRWGALLAALVLIVGFVANLGVFLRGSNADPNHQLDGFTSGRTILWRKAIQHPPERTWLGVGMGNVGHAPEVLDMGWEGGTVKHLHSFLMDAWYETGLLGVSALLGLIGSVLVRLSGNWRSLSPEDRQRAGILLSALMAIIAAALFSFGYTSRYFALYGFVCLGGLSYFAAIRAAADRSPDRH